MSNGSTPNSSRDGRLPVWAVAVLATIGAQTATAFMIRVIPTLGPALAARGGFDESVVGHFSAVHTAGSILFLVCGVPLMRRYGPLRALQIGIVMAAAGSLLLAVPSMALAFVACLFVGLGYGPSAPAGTDILQRFAPQRHRALIFSLKQAGVPLGGVLAGLTLPPLAVYDVGYALLFASAIVLVIAFAVEPARAITDSDRDRALRLNARAFLAFDTITAPLRAVLRSKSLPRLALAGMGFAVAQGSIMAFQVTYLATVAGLSLTFAGSLSAVMYVTGMFGRVLLGWVSDRLGSGIIALRAVSLTSAATLAAFAATGPQTPAWVLVFLSGLAGITVMSWNGVILSEMAKRCEPQRISEMASGATMLSFIGYVVGPSGFAFLLALTGDWSLCFAAAAIAVAAALPVLLTIDRESPRP